LRFVYQVGIPGNRRFLSANHSSPGMFPMVVSIVRWLFSEVLVCAVVLLAMAWMSGVLSS
jgi:hypothetical protein